MEDVPPDWWGFKYGFVSGGYLGANSTRKKRVKAEGDQRSNERTTFCEDDQENLYNLVQVCVLCQLLSLHIISSAA